MSEKTGVLLINLGTPQSPDRKSVRRYLKEFLSDPRVIDLPALARWVLVNAIILPFRARASSQLYQSIWTQEGSPLLCYSKKLCEKVAQQLGTEDYAVALGMRYGQPNIAQGIQHLIQQQVDHIVALPLFPQYSSAASGSAIAKCLQELSQQVNIPSFTIVRDFFQHPSYRQALTHSIATVIKDNPPDYLLLSYHGLPERQIRNSEDLQRSGCDLHSPCPKIQASNRYCYRAQCYATSACLQEALSFSTDKIGTSFQSRLGKTPWIKPYTDEVLPQLAKQGIKHLAIACPSFVADCLETLEEIAIRAKKQWLALGGTKLTLIPCLNDQPQWVQAVVDIALAR